MRIAHGLLNPAPLDLRVNLARIGRDEALAQLAASGIEAVPTTASPAGIRLSGKPDVRRLVADHVLVPTRTHRRPRPGRHRQHVGRAGRGAAQQRNNFV